MQVSRWVGQSKASLTTDVYGHVVIDPLRDEWRTFWLDVYAAGRRPGEVPVRSGAITG